MCTSHVVNTENVFDNLLGYFLLLLAEVGLSIGEKVRSLIIQIVMLTAFLDGRYLMYCIVLLL